MCMPAKCRTCGKASYVGCGAHVEQVLRGVAAADRCTCRQPEAQRGARTDPEAPPAAPTPRSSR